MDRDKVVFAFWVALLVAVSLQPILLPVAKFATIIGGTVMCAVIAVYMDKGSWF